jgi:hypothetical protein
VREERRQAELQAAAAAAGKAPLSPLFAVGRRWGAGGPVVCCRPALPFQTPPLASLTTTTLPLHPQQHPKKPTAAQRIGLVPQ